MSHEEAERQAWATVNEEPGGGKKARSGRGQSEDNASSRKGGQKGDGGAGLEARSAAAKTGWKTRRKKAKN